MVGKDIKIYIGDISCDDRGSLRFSNDFDFSSVKRFYQISNYDPSIIRAFHGHLKEGKYFYVVKGSVLLCAVKMTRARKPSKKEKVIRMVLSDQKPKVVYIPPGYANGMRVLDPKSIIMVYSTASIAESLKDDYRFPYNYWGKKIWQTENR